MSKFLLGIVAGHLLTIHWDQVYAWTIVTIGRII